MKWQFKYMIDPGDGIVTTKIIKHPSDDICEVVTDIFNGEVPGIAEDEQHNFNGGGWMFEITCLGMDDED